MRSIKKIERAVNDHIFFTDRAIICAIYFFVVIPTDKIVSISSS